ncbi:hypothetical protein CCAND93_820002 [Capnocytophaga canis]|uniref:Uncharacterized protein n=1 Tax=Capnocytophaga canis TaxID=1848903 RepID=A0A0B7IWH3_9FLAO|nr:hypothetical protein CCAND93_820002 [Capnocytophaga canis]
MQFSLNQHLTLSNIEYYKNYTFLATSTPLTFIHYLQILFIKDQ